MSNTKQDIEKILADQGIQTEFTPGLVNELVKYFTANLDTASVIAQLRSEIFEKETFKKGSNCPVCERKVALRGRVVDKSMAKILIKLYEETMKDIRKAYHHVDDLKIPYASSGISKLRYWGLIREKAKQSKLDKSTGMWFITQKGKDFVRKEINIPKYAHVYNNTVHYHSGPNVNIEDCLGTPFNYKELITNAA